MSLLIASSCVTAAGIVYAGSCFAEVHGLHDWLVPGAIWRTPHAYPVLTFDDGPHPDRTPRLLDVLARQNARAVFFVTGVEAEKYPQLVRRMAEEGHQVGNHSWNHLWQIWRSTAVIRREIARCQEIIGEITGTPAKYARPPYGQKDFRYYSVLREFSLTPVLWSRNVRDYWGTSAATLLARLQRSRAGDILLMHDGDPKARYTIEAVDAWLKANPPHGLL